MFYYYNLKTGLVYKTRIKYRLHNLLYINKVIEITEEIYEYVLKWNKRKDFNFNEELERELISLINQTYKK